MNRIRFMKKQSSGLLLARVNSDQLDNKSIKSSIDYLIVHPGGPFYENKDEGIWSIPKGEIEQSEEKRTASLREFKEETNLDLNCKYEDLIELGETKLKSGKIIHAFGFIVRENFEIKNFKSNLFEMEWPHKSGKKMKFPEVDKVDFFSKDIALKKIHPAQSKFISTFEEKILQNQI